MNRRPAAPPAGTQGDRRRRVTTWGGADRRARSTRPTAYDSVSVSPADSSPASLPASTTPSPTTNPADSSPASLPASTTPSPTTNPADSSNHDTSAIDDGRAVPGPGLRPSSRRPYGYSFKYLDRGRLIPATESLGPGEPTDRHRVRPCVRCRRNRPDRLFRGRVDDKSFQDVGSRSMNGSTSTSSAWWLRRAPQPARGDHHRWAVGQGLGVSEPDRGDRRRGRAALPLRPGPRSQ